MVTSGVVPGSTVGECAVRVAGALAELGVARAHVEMPGGPTRMLFARLTDLPGIIGGSPGARIVADDVGITLRVEPGQLTWEARDEVAAARWLAVLEKPVNPAG